MKLRTEPLVAVGTALSLTFVVISVFTAGQAEHRQPFPFGPEAPPGCSEYGGLVFKNVSYWYCDRSVNQTYLPVERTELTFADVNFTFFGILTSGLCGIVVVDGLEIDGANTSLDLFGGGGCGFPSAIELSTDHEFGARWMDLFTVELLVPAAPF